MNVILFAVTGNPRHFLPDVAAALERAQLPFTMFAATDARTLPLDTLREKGLITATYNGTSRHVAYDIGQLILFEALAAVEEEYAVVVDDSVMVKGFFLEGLDAQLKRLPAGWDVLFLDCPVECGAPERPVLKVTAVAFV